MRVRRGSDTPTLTWISLPFLSLAVVTLNAERTEQATMKTVEPTRWRPGQILLPTPNANDSTGSSRTIPSLLRNRSGLNSSGSGYLSGSCSIALKVSQIKIHIDIQRTYHAFATTIDPFRWIRPGYLRERHINGCTQEETVPFGMKRPL